MQQTSPQQSYSKHVVTNHSEDSSSDLIWPNFNGKKKEKNLIYCHTHSKISGKRLHVAIAQKRTSKRTSNFSPSHLQTVVPHSFRLLDILLDECCESKHWCRYNIARGVSFIFIRDRKLTSDKRKMKVDKLRVIVCLSKCSARNNRLSQT